MSDFYTSSIHAQEEDDDDISSYDSSIHTPSNMQPPPYFTPSHQHNQYCPPRQRNANKPRPMSMPILPSPTYTSSSPAPPNYDFTILEEDPYTRTTKKWQHRRSCMILPREEEGCEDLPAYHCTVYKMAKVNMKMELCTAGKKINRRPWR
jgi:hypothetical protein